jgi:SAM-dependent methyltransferase
MTNAGNYQAQDRGGAAAYDAYFAGMDTTMWQKLAFVGAHFLLDPGSRIADMGCGSGSGTYQLALLHPQIRVIGVDINSESVRIAAEKYRLPNLEFRIGDAAEPLFAGDPLDGILSSSTLHHVYTFNGYSRDAVRRALRSHLQCLREGGAFVLRDFVSPSHEGYVLLDLPCGESRGDTPAELCDADLLLRFARTARPLDTSAGPGFFIEEIDPAEPDTRRFRLPHKWAAEFVLRKDYRRDWDVELLEEYTYFTAEEFAEELARAGGRLLSAEPYWNPWIVANRFVGRFRMSDEQGRPLSWPATNFVAMTQRVRDGGGVRLIERRAADKAPSFLQLAAMRDTSAPEIAVFDLVRRPGPVCDLLPWRVAAGRLRLAARHGYPRPITCAIPRGPSMIDGARWGGYLIEPITGMVPHDSPVETMAEIVLERAGIAREGIVRIDPGLSYYPSPGGIDEIVHALFVEVAGPVSAHSLSTTLSGLDTAGEIREFDAQRLLRAAHVGVLPEARIEINLYALMDRLGIRPDPFIGEPIEFPADQASPVTRADLDALLARPTVTPFAPADTASGYLRLIRSVFAEQGEQNGSPRTLAEHELEFALPRHTSINTALALPLVSDRGELLVGIETRLLPAPQRAEGNARLLTAPAWRLDRTVDTLDAARAFVAAQFGTAKEAVTPLGAAYFPSAGITPERVHPFAVRFTGDPASLPYDFVPLSVLRARIRHLRDGHLLVGLLRLAHALGLTATSD